MKKFLNICFYLCFFPFFLFSQEEGRLTISLNGEWDFDQTKTAFPPAKYTRKIPVPGLVHLAKPPIEEYDKLFQKPKKVEKMELRHDFFTDYTPKYNWYRRKIKIDQSLSDRKLFLTIKKSQYVTVVYVNGRLMERSVECYTPIDVNITDAVKFGEENEILIQVGDRAWLPSEAAGSTDKEKIRYLSGIWDDVFITATGKLKVDKVLFLPSLSKKTVTAKILVRSAFPPQLVEIDPKEDPCRVEFTIREKKSGRTVATQTVEGPVIRDNKTYFEVNMPVQDPVAWSPENPFLYEGLTRIYHQDQLTDAYAVNFGMRDFKAKGRIFTLNGEKYYLRGSNITLQRFFEDPDCGNLAWDKEWVKKMLIDIPKSLDWNAMRICVGIVPSFWYDLCDEYGILLQNEWLYWQVHGWDHQLRQEYTNWVWSDGNHPSIIIWDAINENWNPYVGNVLIPELKQLDPTRIRDAGWMSAEDMGKNKEMDEPHPYRMASYETLDSLQMARMFRNRPYNLGSLSAGVGSRILDAGVPQLVNEYGWIFLWRNGSPSKISINNYNYYLGRNASPEDCRNMQAYWLQLETEWLRAERSIAGVLSFCYLANNYAYTGDWFINNIKDLEPSPTLKWFKHCFAPEAVFIDVTDGRYTKHIPPQQPGSNFIFNLVGINDLNKISQGKITVKLLDATGQAVIQNQSEIRIDSYGKLLIPTLLKLPEVAGGYVIVAEYFPEGRTHPVISRRYIKIGNPQNERYVFFEMKP